LIVTPNECDEGLLVACSQSFEKFIIAGRRPPSTHSC
jgi:hypothetical protein